MGRLTFIIATFISIAVLSCAPAPVKPPAWLTERENHVSGRKEPPPPPPIWVQCPEAEAERVVVVELTVPQLLDSKQFRFPMRRNPLPPPDIQPLLALNECADGWNARGATGVGYCASIEVLNPAEAELRVSIDLNWTSRVGLHGDVNAVIQVPREGKVVQTLSDRVQVTAYERKRTA
jgi:hypothetical protein